MKRLICLSLFFLAAFAAPKAKAQLSVNVNIGSQPLWGPVGYDYASYYYLPDIETYYYVPKRQFIYLNGGGNWVFSSSLPAAYRSYNLYDGYKVVINSPKPYLNFKADKVKYAKFKGNKGQMVISRSNDPKYAVAKGHQKQAKHLAKVKVNPGKGHGGGNGNGKGKGKH